MPYFTNYTPERIERSIAEKIHEMPHQVKYCRLNPFLTVDKQIQYEEARFPSVPELNFWSVHIFNIICKVDNIMSESSSSTIRQVCCKQCSKTRAYARLTFPMDIHCSTFQLDISPGTNPNKSISA